MLADELDYVVGVDTHRDEHVIAVVAAPAGAMIAAAAAAANVHGYREVLRVADAACAWSPCLGGRGQRQLRRRAWPVSSANAASWCSRSAADPGTERRLRGKDDALDAVRAARTALASDGLHCRGQVSDARR